MKNWNWDQRQRKEGISRVHRCLTFKGVGVNKGEQGTQGVKGRERGVSVVYSPLSCRMESYTLHWIWPVLWNAQDIHNPSYMDTAVMMFEPTKADIFHWGKMVPMMSPNTARRPRANPKICIPEWAIVPPTCFYELNIYVKKKVKIKSSCFRFKKTKHDVSLTKVQ